jgi:translation initiation factor IF-2
MNEIVLDTTIRTEVDGLSQKAIVIRSQEDRAAISTDVKSARYIRSRVETFFKEMKANAHKTWKSICSLEKSYTDQCDEFEAKANRAILSYDAEVRRIQLKLAEDAEAKRQAEEKARQDAEAARALAEDAEDESTIEAREEAAEEAREAERKAEAARQEAQRIERECAAMQVRKSSGESVRITMKARVVDVEKVPRMYMMVNQSMLDTMAKTNKDLIKAGQFKIDGVEFYEDSTIVRKNV